MTTTIRMAVLALALAFTTPALASPHAVTTAGLMLDTLGMNIGDSGPSNND